ncbi:hypothetical protein GPECTOR_21g710 [Gonium pectorale]|uniref:Uncharacterized protein n=1 Tax=Gonium pectorale TaxID=33097 RepID=A0A150GI32_GONPE|nr:hypothetical protein GPECTOR_21g710 [Gonium pectorale]|eukprot:KXZ49484.1 hypothetical protein GPECTOR_21g710 [Gonium pectorale]
MREPLLCADPLCCAAAAAGLLPELRGLSLGSAGGAAAADTARTDDEDLSQKVRPYRVCKLSLEVFNGCHLAMWLASYAKAAGIRGTVQHMSTNKSEFTLVTDKEGGVQALKSCIEWLQQRDVEVRWAADELRSVAVPLEDSYAVVKDIVATSTQSALQLFWGGKLESTFVTSELQLNMEKALKEAVQKETGSLYSLGRSSSQSFHE